MTGIKVIYAEKKNGDCQFCWLELSNGAETYFLPANAPADVVDLATHFQAREKELWQIAKEKAYAPDIYARIPTKALLLALVEALLGEINLLRQKAGMSSRTREDFVRLIKDSLNK